MNARPKRKQPATPARSRNRLRVGSASLFDDPEPLVVREPFTVPTRWVNFVIALFLLPLAGIWSETFFTITSRETLHHRFWATEEFWFFCLGSILWLIVFFGRPRLMVVVYVFGHELTHAIWVWLMGGRVSQFKVGTEGGHIMTDKQNVWISLAPYFYPVYSVAVVILYGLAGLFWNMAPWTRYLFLALGVTWSFHISFTLWMIPKGQTDLSHHGTFYSLVLIYMMNLAVITGLVLIAAPQATVHGFLREFMENGASFTNWAEIHIRQWQG